MRISGFIVQKRPILILSFTVFFCMIIIVLLYAVSEEDVRYTQPFERKLILRQHSKPFVFELNHHDLYIAGVSGKYLYLAKGGNVDEVLILDLALPNVRNETIKLDSPVGEFRNPFLEIDSPFFYIKDGNIPLIVKGDLKDWKGEHVYHSIPPFSQATPLPGKAFAVKSLLSSSSDNLRNVLCKIGTDSPYVEMSPVDLSPGATPYYGQNGHLLYNDHLDIVVYTYMYCNRFLVLNPDLELIYEGHTLDTISLPRIKRSEISEGVYALASPPAVVNRFVFTSGKWLFVNSATMGRLENRESFDKASVIDVYDLTTGEYRYSFYLPDYKNYKMQSFRVTKNRVVAIFGPYLVIYDLNDEVLQ